MDIEEWEAKKLAIVDYYNRSWPSYLKYISKTNLGIHYGYHTKDNKNHNEAMLNMNNQVALALKLKKELKYSILDAGCGVGGTMIYLAKKFPNIFLTGINISDEQIKLARNYSDERGVKDQVNFLNRDYLDTKFPEEMFDAVYALESMGYAYDKHIFVKEAKRILKPGGRFAVLDGFRNGKYPKTTSLERKYKLWREGWGVGYKLDTQFNFKRYLEQENFKNIIYRDITLNILPSSNRIYNIALISLIKLFFMIFLSRFEDMKIPRAAIYQNKLLKSRYFIYGAFSAQKSF
jgi:cyclopropane fatty-acyl-phospholipid synthase-like methyltransferase